MSNIEHLTNYGNELVAAGYQVWLTRTPTRDGGYLQYRDPQTGCCGSLQLTEWDGWQHLMPIIPSREYGSSMHLDRPAPPFTVEAARQCAQPFNHNAVVGKQPNARDRTWRSNSATALHNTTD